MSNTNFQVEVAKLNNLELNQTIKNLAAQERKLTEQILWHIAEVDRRKLFLRFAYSSLFDYLTKEIGYTAGSAQRRINAARLIQKLPEVSEKIKSGALNLGQISKVQHIQRQIKKDSGLIIAVSEQKDLLKILENKSLEQTDVILAQHFNLEIKSDEKKHYQRDESVRVELTFSKEEMALIKKAQALLSNKTGGSLKDTLLAMAQKTIQESTPKPTSAKTTNIKANKTERPQKKIAEPQTNFESQITNNNNTRNLPSTSTMEVKIPKTVTPKLKQYILNRDTCCQFKDPLTGRICGSIFYLEVDHITPRFAQGINTKNNLRMLCRNHNQFRYQAGL